MRPLLYDNNPVANLLPDLLRVAEAGLDRLATGLAVINEHQQLVRFNQFAHKIFATNDGLSVTKEGRLLCYSPQATELRRLIGLAFTGEAENVLRIGRPSQLAPYEVLIVPAQSQMAALFIRDPSQHTIAEIGRLRMLYALTSKEARLVQALMQGKSLEQCAETFSVSKETLRTQIKSAFQKTGTRSQLELISFFLRSISSLRK